MAAPLLSLPPASKAALVAAVVVVTVVAQKPADVSTDAHGLTRIEEGVPAMPTENPAVRAGPGAGRIGM